MRKLHWPIAALIVLALTVALSACGSLLPPATLASGQAASLAGGGTAAIVNGQYQEGVVVSGTGTASADPDTAQVTFGVELQGPNPDELVSQAAQTMDAAMAAAADFGINADKTQTVAYNLWVETVRDPNTGQPTGEIVYHLSHQVQVTTDRIDAVGELLAGVVDAGVNVVNGVNFSVQDSSALEEQARNAALANAEAKAQQIADQLGISLGRPTLVIETGNNAPVPVYAAQGLGGGAAMDVASPSVTPGSFSVTVSVQIVYAIQ